MSMSYSLSMNIKANFTRDSIYRILENGNKIGFVYYDNIPGETYLDAPVIDSLCATNKILENNEVSQELGKIVLTKFEDTSFDFGFHELENYELQICFSNMTYPWRREFWNGGKNKIGLDFSRYAHLQLKICKDFSILALETLIF